MQLVITDEPMAFGDVFRFEDDTAVEPVVVDVLQNDVAPAETAEIDRGALRILQGPSFGEATVPSDGRIGYAPDGAEGWRSTRIAYAFDDTDGRASNESVLRIAGDCEPPEPFVADGVELTRDDATGLCRGEGTFTIGRLDGAGRLLRVVDGAIVIHDDRIEVLNAAAILAAAAEATPAGSAPIFKGSFTLFADGRPGPVIESGVIEGDLELATFEFLARSIVLEPQEIRLGGQLAFPEKLGAFEFDLPGGKATGRTSTPRAPRWAAGWWRCW